MIQERLRVLRERIENTKRFLTSLVRQRTNQGAQQETTTPEVFNPNNIDIYSKVPDDHEISGTEKQSYDQQAISYFRGHVTTRLAQLRHWQPDQKEILEKALDMFKDEDELFRSLKRLQSAMFKITALQHIFDILEFNEANQNAASNTARVRNLALIFKKFERYNIFVQTVDEPIFKDDEQRVVRGNLKVEEDRWVIEMSESNQHDVLLIAELICDQILTRRLEKGELSIEARNELDRTIAERLFMYATDRNVRPILQQQNFRRVQTKAGRVAFSIH